MKITLTGRGALARQFPDSEVVSYRELAQSEFEAKIKSADCILHNAATINCGDNCYERNYEFTKYLVDLNPPGKFIYIGSMSAINPVTPYGWSKYMAEQYCLKKGISVVRFATIFYHDNSKDGLSNLIYNAVKYKKISLINGGIAKRNFVSIYDIQKALHGMCIHGCPKVVNLTGKTYSFKNVAEILVANVPDLVIVDEPGCSTFVEYPFENEYNIGFDLLDQINSYIGVINDKLR